MMDQNIRMFSRVMFNPAFFVCMCVLFVVLCAFLIVKKKALSVSLKIPMFVGIGICLLYFAFRLFGIFFAGGSAH